MRAIGYLDAGDSSVLHDTELPEPVPGPRDLLVEVAAVSVNPVDTKVRARTGPDGADPTMPKLPKVLGWDAVGVVRQIGAEVVGFRAGDRVWYAGAVNRAGSNSERHLVDEQIASLAPTTLDDADAAAMPLTSITAWELLFDRLGAARDGGDHRTLLVVGAGGGVGSILVQLARTLTDLTVVGTASREDSADWVRSMGAHHVVDHRDLVAGVRATGLGGVDLVASLTHTDTHFPSYAELLAPQGRVALIDDPEALDIRPLKQKSASVHWEWMFTRAVFGTADLGRQQEILREVTALVDKGALRSTRTTTLGTITADNLRRAHDLQEGGRTIGKTVLVGWPA